MYTAGVALALALTAAASSGIYRNYSQIFNPLNYMNQLPSLSLPYVNNVPIPSLRIPIIKPTPVVTRVINVVTKYVTKNPVCIKVSGKKKPCGALNKNGAEFLVTKEYFVTGGRQNNIQVKDVNYREHRLITEGATDEDIFGDVHGSEDVGNFVKVRRTPALNFTKIKELLIEDRLDYLEDILPQYTRLKVYQTRTITVTKQLTNNRATATLMVKNCIPQDMQLCPSKTKGKRSKNTSTRLGLLT